MQASDRDLDRIRLTPPATILLLLLGTIGCRMQSDPVRSHAARDWDAPRRSTTGDRSAPQNALPATMRTLAYGLNSAERMIPLTSRACSLNSWNGTSSTSVSPTILRISW